MSIRLHGELEQAQEWRITTENLNKELKKQLDELKDHLDNEVILFKFFFLILFFFFRFILKTLFVLYQ